jgi:hypothetical protein
MIQSIYVYFTDYGIFGRFKSDGKSVKTADEIFTTMNLTNSHKKLELCVSKVE